MKRMIVLTAVCTVILSCFFGIYLFTANAEENIGTNSPVYERFYTNISIQEGDSLWSIAKRYKRHSGMSTREYVYELKQINRLYSDQINSGDCLTVVYFAEQAED